MKDQIYTKALGKMVAMGANPDIPKNVHVIEGSGHKWSVVKDGMKRSTRVFDTQIEAINFAKSYSVEINAESIVVHTSDGAFSELSKTKHFKANVLKAGFVKKTVMKARHVKKKQK